MATVAGCQVCHVPTFLTTPASLNILVGFPGPVSHQPGGQVPAFCLYNWSALPTAGVPSPVCTTVQCLARLELLPPLPLPALPESLLD